MRGAWGKTASAIRKAPKRRPLRAAIRALRDRTGSTIAEAALVFPVVILAVTAVLYICIHMYMICVLQAETHIELRRAEGRESGTLILSEQVSGPRDRYAAGAAQRTIDTEKAERAAEPLMKAYSEIGTSEGGGLLGGYSREIGAEAYVIDEEQFIRYLDILKA